jgi:hypothetical protein
MPTVGCLKGIGEFGSYGFGLFGCLLFLFVEDAEEENPGDFGDVLQCSGAVGAAHDVADGFDVAVEGLLGVELTARGFCGAGHGKSCFLEEGDRVKRPGNDKSRNYPYV